MPRRLSQLLAAASLLLLTVGAAGAVAAPKPARSLAVDGFERAVLAELNDVRREHGLVPLRFSRPLTAAADGHSRAMAEHGFFTHESRDGSAFWKRVQRHYGADGSDAWSVGENLLWSTTGIDARDAVRLWLDSPGHRRNILTARWREIGISAVVAAAAPGVFGGREVVIVTTNFGVR